MRQINIALLLLALPLSGCASRPDYTLNLPFNSDWVNVIINLPAQTEVMPMDVLYRSDICQREDYDSTTESHIRKERGYNPQIISMIPQSGNNIWQGKIFLDGGGKCKWKLSVIRIDLQPNPTMSLSKGKEIIQTSYAFRFDNEDYVGGGGVGSVKVSDGDLVLKTILFPMVVINNALNKQSLRYFAGDVSKEKWSRHYKVNNVKNITIEPYLYIDKVVMLESPKNKDAPAGMTITDPDGKVELKRAIIPDYERLLSMQ